MTVTVSPCTSNKSGFILSNSLSMCSTTLDVQLRQGLPVAHQVEIVIRLNFKPVQHLIEHFSVLRGQDYYRLKMLGSADGMYYRGKLDSFRTRSKHAHHALFMIANSTL